MLLNEKFPEDRDILETCQNIMNVFNAFTSRCIVKIEKKQRQMHTWQDDYAKEVHVY